MSQSPLAASSLCLQVVGEHAASIRIGLHLYLPSGVAEKRASLILVEDPACLMTVHQHMKARPCPASWKLQLRHAAGAKVAGCTSRRQQPGNQCQKPCIRAANILLPRCLTSDSF